MRELQAKAGNGALLPKGLALNVNFPNGVKTTTPFAFSKVGSFNLYNLKFKNAVPYGSTGTSGSAGGKPTATQLQDESYVSQSKISVTAMQVSFDHRPTGQEWLKLRLRNLFN